jgi:hypothetical protein
MLTPTRYVTMAHPKIEESRQQRLGAQTYIVDTESILVQHSLARRRRAEPVDANHMPASPT